MSTRTTSPDPFGKALRRAVEAGGGLIVDQYGTGWHTGQFHAYVATYWRRDDGRQTRALEVGPRAYFEEAHQAGARKVRG